MCYAHQTEHRAIISIRFQSGGSVAMAMDEATLQNEPTQGVEMTHDSIGRPPFNCPVKSPDNNRHVGVPNIVTMTMRS